MLRANEFRSFFDGNSSYISNYDFTVATTVDTKLITLSGLSFTLSKESVVSGLFWNITTGKLIPAEDVTITTGPDTITFNDLADDFDGTEEVLVILHGPNRLASASGLSVSENPSEVSSVPTAISVTDTAQDVTLTKAEILNDGANTIFFRDNGSDADTDDYPLYPDERIFLKGSISVVCDTGLTSTLRILEVV